MDYWRTNLQLKTILKKRWKRNIKRLELEVHVKEAWEGSFLAPHKEKKERYGVITEMPCQLSPN